MCVIIGISKGKMISDEEIEKAWNTNSDGAGYMYRKDGKVYYKRGFMDKDEYIEEVKKIMGKYSLVLHLRISTSSKVNKMQTHPYELDNITQIQGVTEQPVSCMNGIVSRTAYDDIPDCNDTMSYIVQNNELFKKFITLDNMNDKIHLIDFIKEHSGAKWAVMTPTETLFSGGFIEEDGVWYSNLNHRRTYIYNYDDYYYPPVKTYKQEQYKRILVTDVLKRKVVTKLDTDLYNEIYDYVTEYCDICEGNECRGCLKKCNTVDDVLKFHLDNYNDFEVLKDSYYNDNLFYDDVGDYWYSDPEYEEYNNINYE